MCSTQRLLKAVISQSQKVYEASLNEFMNDFNFKGKEQLQTHLSRIYYFACTIKMLSKWCFTQKMGHRHHQDGNSQNISGKFVRFLVLLWSSYS